MTESQILWIGMTGISLLISILVLFVRTDEESVKKVSRFSPIAGLFRYKWWKYFVASALFCLSILSFAVFKGWIS